LYAQLGNECGWIGGRSIDRGAESWQRDGDDEKAKAQRSTAHGELLVPSLLAAAAAKGHGVTLKARKESDGDDSGCDQEGFHVPRPIKDASN